MSLRRARFLCLIALAAPVTCTGTQGGRTNNASGGQNGAAGVRNFTDSDVATGIAASGDNVFVSTYRGVLRYPAAGGDARRMTTRDGLPDDNVFGVSASSDGVVWAATARGVVKLTGDRWARVGDVQPNVNRITAILGLEGGQVLLGGAQGLARFDGTAWHLLTDQYQVTALTLDQGRPLVATANAGVIALRGDFNTLDEYGTTTGIPETLVRNIVSIGSGRFWTLLQGSSGARLGYYDGHRWAAYTHSQVRSPWLGLVASQGGSGAALVIRGQMYDIVQGRGEELIPTEVGNADSQRRIELHPVRLEAPPPPVEAPPPPTRGRGRGRPAPARRAPHALLSLPPAAPPVTIREEAFESARRLAPAPVPGNALSREFDESQDEAERGAQVRRAGDAGTRAADAGARAMDGGSRVDAGARARDGAVADAASTSDGSADGAVAERPPAVRPRNIPAYAAPIEPQRGGPSINAPRFGLVRNQALTVPEDTYTAFGNSAGTFIARVGLGVSRIAGGAATDYRSHDLAMQRRPLSLATDPSNNVWLVTESLAAVKYDGTRFTHAQLDPEGAVVPLMFWSRGNTAAAVGRVGPNVLRTYRFGGGAWRAVTERPIDTGGPGVVDVKFLSVDDRGRYWVGIRVENEGRVREHGVAVIDEALPSATQFNSRVAPTGGENGAMPAPDDLTAVAFDQVPSAWFAGLSGATHITLPTAPGQPATVQTFNETSGLRGDLVSDLAPGPNNRIYIATTEGIGYHDGTRFSFDVVGSTAATRVIALAVDNGGQLWGAGQRGAWRYNGQEFGTVGRIDGLPSEVFNDLAVDGENRVWFVTAEGISILTQPRGAGTVTTTPAPEESSGGASTGESGQAAVTASEAPASGTPAAPESDAGL